MIHPNAPEPLPYWYDECGSLEWKDPIDYKLELQAWTEAQPTTTEESRDEDQVPTSH